MLDRRVLTTPGIVAAVVAILTYFNITPVSLLKLWANATKIETLSGHANRVTAVAIGRDGKIIASSSGDGTIELWDGKTFQDIGTFLSDVCNKDLSFSLYAD
ncbi:MAG: hypothetical protein GDA38_22830 [Hormoscilla sp. SP12CHS1]|nr:hypothetical protein [Hormoscilla sp. SP12CHS1]